jgi:RNA recognition motif-containing protein
LTVNGLRVLAGSCQPGQADSTEMDTMSRKIYVGNMNYATTEDSLRELFSQFGGVDSVAVIVDRATGRAKGFAFVEMENEEAAQSAIQKLDGQEFEGRKLRVNEAQGKPAGPAPRSY